jgi:hypothetical protein
MREMKTALRRGKGRPIGERGEFFSPLPLTDPVPPAPCVRVIPDAPEEIHAFVQR